jgi:hypothetical protein
MKNFTLKIVLDEEEEYGKFLSLVAALKNEVHFIFEVFEELEKK